MLRIKEIFSTIQGEGSKAGKPAIFVRLSGCNLWSGIEKHRQKGKGDCALWCDTDFVKGEKYSEVMLIDELNKLTKDWKEKFIVITGGEPTLQLKKNENVDIIKKLLDINYTVAIETNGTIDCEVLDILHAHPNGHITVSPKPLMGKPSTFDHIKRRKGTDLKVVIPTPFDLDVLKEWDFGYYYLQPVDKGDLGLNSIPEVVENATKYGYQVCIQSHKFLGME